MKRKYKALVLCFILANLVAYTQRGALNKEVVYQDEQGVIRWATNKQEAAFFGANYCLPSACDYRAAGYVTSDRKKMVDQDMAHFARMGWNASRLSFWGDYENTDTSGNLVSNDHLNIMDYVIAKAKERGIYILLSPIVTYSSQWPDAMQDTVSARGFSTYFKKEELGTNPRAIAAQQNYLKQLLNHVNPYTGIALKNEPAIIFVEMINEPWHHSDDVEGSVRYINALIDAVRSTGCQKILFHNYSQDFNMAKPIQQSKIQGVTFAWYPSGLNSGNTLQGNYLPVVDHYSSEMLRPELSKLSKIVYEFDTPDLLTGYLYPAMARSFREVGAQWATMFSYDMLQTAPYNLGWQTHFLNMVYTPVKAVSAIIAAEVMKNIPMYKSYGNYPANTSFGPFKINYSNDLSEMVTADKFIYANTTQTTPANTFSLKKITGHGSSPVVYYEGQGIYFLDKIKEGTWRLEVYPDAVLVDDPFKMPSPGKLVSRSISRSWPMSVQLPDLSTSFSVHPINAKNNYNTEAQSGSFSIKPGVYILTTDKSFKKTSLPQKLGYIAMDEFIVLEDQKMLMQVMLNQKSEYVSGKPVIVSANVYSKKDPQSVTLFVRNAAPGRFYPIPMKRDTGYTYKAALAANRVQEGFIEYCIVVKDSNVTLNYPSGIHKSPADWDYYGSVNWHSKIVAEGAPLRLLNPSEDVSKTAFTRIGDNGRSGVFKMLPASNTGDAAFHLELPLSIDRSLDDYTLSVPVKDKIASRKAGIENAQSLVLNVKGVSQNQDAYITLVENDGTSWSQKIALSNDWKMVTIPLNELKLSKGVMLPLGYPGRWNYWFTPASGRAGAGDNLKMENVEWLQLSVRPSGDRKDNEAKSYIEITSAVLSFEK